jgi:hypothetical protein
LERNLSFESFSIERPSFHTKRAVKARQRVKDLKRFARHRWGRSLLPRTAEARRYIAICLHHFAPYAEGRDLADKLLSLWTDWKPAERAAVAEAEFNTARYYDAEGLAGLIELTMPVRYTLGITTIGAIDFPLAARKRLQQLKKNAKERRKGQLQPKDRVGRRISQRLDAIVEALPRDGSPLRIRELGALLVGSRPFARVTPTSMSKTLRRLIEDDNGQRLIMSRSGQLFSGAMVRRRSDPVRKSSAPPPPPQGSWATPTDAAEFERWFFSELGRFTSENAGDMARWFYEPAAKILRSVCRVSELEEDLAKIAKRRRDELLGTVGQRAGRRVA